jgi:hypothetical protein
MATVEATYNIDEEVLSDKAEESDYWGRSNTFYQDVKHKDTDDLSPQQVVWLEKIETSLERGR